MCLKLQLQWKTRKVVLNPGTWLYINNRTPNIMGKVTSLQRFISHAETNPHREPGNHIFIMTRNLCISLLRILYKNLKPINDYYKNCINVHVMCVTRCFTHRKSIGTNGSVTNVSLQCSDVLVPLKVPFLP